MPVLERVEGRPIPCNRGRLLRFFLLYSINVLIAPQKCSNFFIYKISKIIVAHVHDFQCLVFLMSSSSSWSLKPRSASNSSSGIEGIFPTSSDRSYL